MLWFGNACILPLIQSNSRWDLEFAFVPLLSPRHPHPPPDHCAPLCTALFFFSIFFLWSSLYDRSWSLLFLFLRGCLAILYQFTHTSPQFVLFFSAVPFARQFCPYRLSPCIFFSPTPFPFTCDPSLCDCTFPSAPVSLLSCTVGCVSPSAVARHCGSFPPTFTRSFGLRLVELISTFSFFFQYAAGVLYFAGLFPLPSFTFLRGVTTVVWPFPAPTCGTNATRGPLTLFFFFFSLMFRPVPRRSEDALYSPKPLEVSPLFRFPPTRSPFVFRRVGLNCFFFRFCWGQTALLFLIVPTTHTNSFWFPRFLAVGPPVSAVGVWCFFPLCKAPVHEFLQ